MSTFSFGGGNPGRVCRIIIAGATFLTLPVVLSGCSNGDDHFDTITAIPLPPSALRGGFYAPAADRDFRRDGTVPWWCQGAPDLTQPECINFSLDLDAVIASATPFAALSDFTAAGAAEIPQTDRPANTGVAYSKTAAPSTFDPAAPNVLLYDGSAPSSRLVGIAWEINAASAPAGFAGNRDTWSRNANTGHWWLTAWVLRGYEYQPDVFAASHPCLTNSGTMLASTGDTCFTDSHPEPFEILVSNDDGYLAAGIDALVEGLYSLPNVVVHVVAPAANQSGSGDATTGEGYEVSASAATTVSGRAATAVYSTDPARPNGSGSPADSVLYALQTQLLAPELVVSGINAGQNMGPIIDVSGTIGAARTGRRNGVPAIATSQGGIVPPQDYPTGVTATLALVEQWRVGHTVNTTTSVLNINIPTCSAGTVRGTLQTVVASDIAGRDYNLQDCTSVATTINDDIDAFNNGFIGIADTGVDRPPNWP